MRRIGAVLDEVKPVVMENPRRFQRSLSGAFSEGLVARQRRWIVAVRTHIGEKDSALLAHRISKMPHFLGKLAASRFARHRQTLPAKIEQPAVVGAANAAVFDVAVFQRRAAMRAMRTDQTDRALLVTK